MTLKSVKFDLKSSIFDYLHLYGAKAVLLLFFLSSSQFSGPLSAKMGMTAVPSMGLGLDPVQEFEQGTDSRGTGDEVKDARQEVYTLARILRQSPGLITEGEFRLFQARIRAVRLLDYVEVVQLYDSIPQYVKILEFMRSIAKQVEKKQKKQAEAKKDMELYEVYISHHQEALDYLEKKLVHEKNKARTDNKTFAVGLEEQLQKARQTRLNKMQLAEKNLAKAKLKFERETVLPEETMALDILVKLQTSTPQELLVMDSDEFVKWMNNIEHLSKGQKSLLRKGTSAEDFRDIVVQGRKAYEKMFLHNMRYVAFIAKKYWNMGLSTQDLISEGATGLRRAIEKFDVEKGYQFSTYAYNWIRVKMWEAIQKNDQFKTPNYVLENRETAKRYRAIYYTMYGEQPSNNQELVDKTNVPLTVEELDTTDAYNRKAVSGNSKLREGGAESNREVLDLVAWEPQQEYSDAELDGQSEAIDRILGEYLDDNEILVLKLVYGIIEMPNQRLPKMSYKPDANRKLKNTDDLTSKMDVAIEINGYSTHVGQIHDRALKKLQQSKEALAALREAALYFN